VQIAELGSDHPHLIPWFSMSLSGMKIPGIAKEKKKKQ
jgi:hypothetical protein